MKELFALIKTLSLETDNEKRKELNIKIDVLKAKINSESQTKAIQKIYNAYR